MNYYKRNQDIKISMVLVLIKILFQKNMQTLQLRKVDGIEQYYQISQGKFSLLMSLVFILLIFYFQITSAPTIIALPVGKISGVKFSLVTSQFLTRQVTEIKAAPNSTPYSAIDGNDLGAVFATDQCNKCKGKGDTKTPCPGHPGWIKLQDWQMFLHPALLTQLQRFMSIFCPFCGQFKMKIYYQRIGIENRQEQLKQLEKLKLETPMFKFLDNLYDLCGSLQCTCCSKKIVYQISQGKIYRKTLSGQKVDNSKELTVNDLRDDFRNKFEKNNQEEMKILNINPEAFIIEKIPVMAKTARPASEMFGVISRHIMTDRYQQILNAVQEHESENNKDEIKDLFSPIVQQDKEVNEQGGHNFKSIPLQLKGKQGLMRMNIMGKRVNYCARSVIGGDPTIGVNELGVPLTVAKTVTVKEYVTDTNREKLQKLIKNGQNYPGAVSVEIPGQGEIKIENFGDMSLKNGYIVNRHLLNGDPVMFNRQPTLHKMSFMSHRAKILPYCTFRMNLSACKPYNADFDGDEMNFHVPQTYLAQSELMNIMSVDKQILTCKNGGPLISITQDAQIGGWVLTRKDTQINPELYQDMVMWGDSTQKKLCGFSQPAVLYPKQVYTGKQMISLILPDKINFDKTDKKDNESYADNYFQDKSVKILNGELLCGYSSGITVAKPGLLLHKIFKDYGSDVCKDFLNSCQRITTYFMQNRGFTIGLSDMIQKQETLDKVQASFEKLNKAQQELLIQSMNQKIKLAPGQTHQQAYEGAIVNRIQTCRDECQDIAIKGLDHRNCLYRLVTSGSKGGPLNIMQISASVGQQLLQGQRMVYRFQSQRGLPHFMSQQFGLTERGFVFHSFIKGMTLQEFYYHMVGGREGVCDTAIKTADSGYVERKLMKNMESVKLCYDGTVRNAANELIQLSYGDDNTDTHKVETMKAVDLLHKPYIQFFDNTYINYQQLSQRQQSQRQMGKQQQKVDIQELIDLLLNDSETNQQFVPVIDDNHDKEQLKQRLLQVMNLLQKKEYQPNNNKIIAQQLQGNFTDDQLKLFASEFLTLLLEHIQLQDYDIYLQQYSQNTSNLENNLSLPMNIKRYFDDAKIQSQIYRSQKQEKLTPEYIIEQVNQTIKYMKSVNNTCSMQFIIAFRYQFCVKQVLKAEMCKKQFDNCLRQIQTKFLYSNAPAGEAVGPLAAHSISEPATQLTLNTFHVAGTSALGQLGLPRLKELINFTNSKIPVMTIRLKQSLGKEETQKFLTIKEQKQNYMKVASLLENKYFQDLIDEERIEYIGQNEQQQPKTLYDEFNELLNIEEVPSNQKSSLQLIYILSQQQLYEIEETKNIQDIVQIIKTYIDNTVAFDDKEQPRDVYIQYNPGFGEQIIKIRISDFTEKQYMQLSEELKAIHIQGIPAIKKVLKNSNNYPMFYDQPEKPKLNGGIFGADSASFVYKQMVEKDDNQQQNCGQIIINTEGSSLLDVFSIEEVDFEHTITNDVPEVYDVLGIEAARSVLLYVMKTVLEGPNLRHFMLLTDVMLQKPYKHKLISINRNGQHITNTSVLAQASFEQPGRTLLDAAVLNLEDNLQSISANVVMGTEAKHGTGSFDLIIDTDKLPQIDEKKDMSYSVGGDISTMPGTTDGTESVLGNQFESDAPMDQSQFAYSNNTTQSNISLSAHSSAQSINSHLSGQISQSGNVSRGSSVSNVNSGVGSRSTSVSTSYGPSGSSISIQYMTSKVMSEANRGKQDENGDNVINNNPQNNSNDDWF